MVNKLEVDLFISESMKLHLVQCWAESYKSIDSAFSYHITNDGDVFFMREQARQLWDFYKNSQNKKLIFNSR